MVKEWDGASAVSLFGMMIIRGQKIADSRTLKQKSTKILYNENSIAGKKRFRETERKYVKTGCRKMYGDITEAWGGSGG
jgi:hypothetical protein